MDLVTELQASTDSNPTRTAYQTIIARAKAGGTTAEDVIVAKALAPRLGKSISDVQADVQN